MSSVAPLPSGNIILPNNWHSRPHQRPFMQHMWSGGKRALLAWHRRSGKDSSCLNFTAVQTQQKVATYWHMLPTAVQGRRVIWDAVDSKTGIRLIDQAFPKEIRAGKPNDTEMRIKFKNGSIWYVVGSDNYDSLVGSEPYGVVFSEWSIADPRAWDFVRPILLENGGWAIFIFTPRGKNHAYEMYKMAKQNPDWFCEILTIDGTFKAPDVPLISKEDYQAEIDSGMDVQLAMQEYYCSFDAGLFGAYYTDQLKMAKTGDYPWDPRKPVHTFWDLGLRDKNAIVFAQEGNTPDTINVIDYEEDHNTSLAEWIKIVHDKSYTYGEHVAPHDIKKRDYKDKQSYINFARDLGIDFEICPDIGLRQGIDATKNLIPKLRFNDTVEVRALWDCLSNYKRKWDDKLKIFLDRPDHDWASHGADAIRVMSITWPNDFSYYSNEKPRVITGRDKRRRRKT